MGLGLGLELELATLALCFRVALGGLQSCHLLLQLLLLELQLLVRVDALRPLLTRLLLPRHVLLLSAPFLALHVELYGAARKQKILCRKSLVLCRESISATPVINFVMNQALEMDASFICSNTRRILQSTVL